MARPTFTPETLLLAPHSPTQHSDDWPIFTITNATITSTSGPDSAEPANLLHADALNTLTITGKLFKLDPSLSHLRLHHTPASDRGQAEAIEISPVRQFAYGQYSDGSVEIWGAGAAGWFSVRPSRAYRAVHAEMVEAVELLYFCADVYGDAATKELDVELFLERWARRKGRGHTSTKWGTEAVERHRRFLIASMLQRKEGVQWAKTPLWRYLEGRYGALVWELRKRMKTAVGAVKVKTASQAGSRSGTPGSQAGTKRKRDDVEGATTRREHVGDTIRVRSATGEPGADSESMMDLSSISRGRSRRLADESASTTVSTPKGKTLATDAIMVDESDDSEPVAAAQKGKSVLRPRQSKYIPKLPVGDDTEEQIEEPSSPVRPLASTSAAPQQIVEERDGPSRPLQRRGTRRTMTNPDQANTGAADVDEGIDMSLDGAEEAEDDSGADQSEALNGDSAIPLRLRPEDLKAKAQGDIWICPLDGCLHKVYAASDPASQILIKEHYRLHVSDDDAEMRMQLVRRMEAPGLPVSRLMSRIQMQAGQRGFPAPITQRY